jgi:hypothetical protein
MRHATSVGLCRALSRRSGRPGWRLKWTEGTGAYHDRRHQSHWTESRAEAEALQRLLRVPGTTLDAALRALFFGGAHQ